MQAPSLYRTPSNLKVVYGFIELTHFSFWTRCTKPYRFKTFVVFLCVLGLSYPLIASPTRVHTEFGFSPSNFTGVERGEAYEVQVGYLSGRPPGNQELRFNVVFINGTAGTYNCSFRRFKSIVLLKSNAMATLKFMPCLLHIFLL